MYKSRWTRSTTVRVQHRYCTPSAGQSKPRYCYYYYYYFAITDARITLYYRPYAKLSCLPGDDVYCGATKRNSHRHSSGKRAYGDDYYIKTAYIIVCINV